MVATTAAGHKFFDNARLLRRIHTFQEEVSVDPSKYNAGILARFELETVSYGRQQLQDMHRILMARDFPTGSIPPAAAKFLEANLQRYIDLWQRNVQNGFATAASSVPGVTRLGTRTMLQRLFDFFAQREATEPQPVPLNIRDKSEMQGIVRTAMVNGRRKVFRIRLAPYLKMLFRTYPMNFLRDHNLIVSRLDIPVGKGEEVFYISAGRTWNSSPVCVLCQGRALTRSALILVTRDLQSPLFHPNCRHRILTTPGGTTETYDGSRGPLVTPQVVMSWVGSGKVKRARRPNPRVINV